MLVLEEQKKAVQVVDDLPVISPDFGVEAGAENGVNDQVKPLQVFFHLLKLLTWQMIIEMI